ncbi:MAG: hypothetical protein D6698_01520 [Gammaproteobacteria bacterium]|nr:MAG: hypothetical protein D6698_01520 [Gammaproteobacteria bacterium]
MDASLKYWIDRISERMGEDTAQLLTGPLLQLLKSKTYPKIQEDELKEFLECTGPEDWKVIIDTVFQKLSHGNQMWSIWYLLTYSIRSDNRIPEIVRRYGTVLHPVFVRALCYNSSLEAAQREVVSKFPISHRYYPFPSIESLGTDYTFETIPILENVSNEKRIKHSTEWVKNRWANYYAGTFGQFPNIYASKILPLHILKDNKPEAFLFFDENCKRLRFFTHPLGSFDGRSFASRLRTLRSEIKPLSFLNQP